MKVISLFISDINVGIRRREDFGDVEGLAESIRKYGLFHPLLVDDENNLLAGERRMIACLSLGWTEIPCRLYRDLTLQERHEIELEENLQRKGLTPYEQSKQLLQDAAKIEEIISTTAVEKDSRGRKSHHSVPKKDIAQALGRSTSNLVRAEQHVAAVERHPELKGSTQREAINKAKAGKPRTVKSVIPKPSKCSPLAIIQEFIYEVKRKGGALSFVGRMTELEQFNFLDGLRNCRNELDTFIAELQDHFDELSSASNF